MKFVHSHCCCNTLSLSLFLTCFSALFDSLLFITSVEEEYEATEGEVLLDNEDNDGWRVSHWKPKGNLLVLGDEGVTVFSDVEHVIMKSLQSVGKKSFPCLILNFDNSLLKRCDQSEFAATGQATSQLAKGSKIQISNSSVVQFDL
ncbi:uncharacterized protein LOC110672833 [Hevea brasiliensis]|uniref:uncharacterized protein LOC110672833 n=1 Tax=Hevea brasiliensis TaxID=3981 RepID=UPI0025DAC256|nr:uncharacterized protein LOC110672833 [Hevea brasiliensis]